MTGPVYIAGNVVILSLILPIIAFIVIYGRRRVWRRSYIGRTLMAQKIAILIVFITFVIQLLVPDLWFRDWIRLVIYLAVGVTWWLDVVNLHRVRHEGMPVAFYDPSKKRTSRWRFWRN